MKLHYILKARSKEHWGLFEKRLWAMTETRALARGCRTEGRGVRANEGGMVTLSHKTETLKKPHRLITITVWDPTAGGL